MSQKPEDTKVQSAEIEEEKAVKTLEEDDEFEDFPEDTKWAKEPDSQVAPASLWEEDWDDDDNQDEFTQQLREELKKAQKAN